MHVRHWDEAQFLARNLSGLPPLLKVPDEIKADIVRRFSEFHERLQNLQQVQIVAGERPISSSISMLFILEKILEDMRPFRNDDALIAQFSNSRFNEEKRKSQDFIWDSVNLHPCS